MSNSPSPCSIRSRWKVSSRWRHPRVCIMEIKCLTTGHTGGTGKTKRNNDWMRTRKNMLRYTERIFGRMGFPRALRAPRGSVLFLALLVSLTPAHAGVTIQSWQAKSGAKVLFVENHDLPMLDVAVHFDAGSRRDIPKRLGRASLTASLMQLGARGM